MVLGAVANRLGVRLIKSAFSQTEPPNAGALSNRIRDMATATASGDELARNLLHAYVACLSFGDLANEAVAFLDGPAAARRAIRNRLTRLASTTATAAELGDFAGRLMALNPVDRLSRTTTDTLLSFLYLHLPLPCRQAVLERWADRGGRGAAGRWLKAIGSDDTLFDGSTVLAYWRRSGDERAAKLLAYKAEPPFLEKVISELIAGVSEGWIVSRAAIRVGRLSDDDWGLVRAAFPATYAYLCAMLKRTLTSAEAIELVRAAGGGYDRRRGLAIWAIGEIGLRQALDAIWAMADELKRDDLAELGFALTAAREVAADE